METGLTKRQIIAELTKSPHGDLKQFVPFGVRAVSEDEGFFAHLIAWNQVKGQVRDSKVALPVIALAGKDLDAEYRENALAHIAMLDPRNLVRAVRFQKSLPGQNHRALRKVVEKYLRVREAKLGWWERTAVQHRESMRELYALLHIKPAEFANQILFKGWAPPGVFQAIKNLPKYTDEQAAQEILNHKIPFLVVNGALGKRARSESLLHALVTVMTPTELVTNMKMLEKNGVRDYASVRGALEAKLEQLKDSKKVTLKTTRAAEVLEADDAVSEKITKRLRDVQEKQIEKLGTIDGNWIILADKSGSMESAIEAARHVAATLTRFVKGQVHLIFFDYSAMGYDCTGKSLEEIQRMTRAINAGGGTSIGSALEWARLKRLDVDGIAIVSDGKENSTPWFSDVYSRWFQDEQPPVYYYGIPTGMTSYVDKEIEHTCRVAGIDLQTFELGKQVDYYSLPNLVQTMRANKYSLVDEILGVPLLKLADVFEK